MSCYIDGQFLPADEGRLPIDDGGLLYGDGIMATILVEKGKPLYLEKHLKRLEDQCTQLAIKMPDLSFALVTELLSRNRSCDRQRLRIIITGGSQEVFGLTFRLGHIAMFVKPYTTSIPRQLKMALFSHPFTVVHAHLKTIANFNRLFVVQEARSRGFDDGITLSPEGYLLEASFGNLFWLVDNKVYIPDRSLPYYFGVTVERVLAALNLPIEEVKIKPQDIPEKAQIYRTNTMNGVVPIYQIEKVEFHSPSIAPIPPPCSSVPSPK